MKIRITTSSSDAYCPAFGRHDELTVTKSRITTSSSDAYCPASGGHDELGRHGLFTTNTSGAFGSSIYGDPRC